MYKALFCLKNYKHNDGAKFDIIYGKYQDVWIYSSGNYTQKHTINLNLKGRNH
jgi:hypothetical protein